MVVSIEHILITTIKVHHVIYINIVKVSRDDFMKHVPQSPKVVIYKNNGSGRDGYIS
jgi:hypothetical protein